MKQKTFIRNVQARDQLELFIISSVSSLLLLRYYLYITGYPQVGNGSLHIAHVLYGGLLMLIAIVLQLSFLGRRVQRVSAFLGGVGFGVFIDEVGKFLTRDNNYFFRPSIGIIYATFVLLYLASTLLTRAERLSSIEYQLNALAQLEEAVLREMDEREKREVERLLRQAASSSRITRGLQQLVGQVSPKRPARPNLAERIYSNFSDVYTRIWRRRGSNTVVQLFFGAEIIVFIIAVAGPIVKNVGAVETFFQGHADYGHSLIIGQAVGTGLAAFFALRGLIALGVSRVDAFEWFRRATLANLLLTEFFIFSRIQFGAMPAFIFNLVLLAAINFVLGHERRAATVPAS